MSAGLAHKWAIGGLALLAQYTISYMCKEDPKFHQET